MSFASCGAAAASRASSGAHVRGGGGAYAFGVLTWPSLRCNREAHHNRIALVISTALYLQTNHSLQISLHRSRLKHDAAMLICPGHGLSPEDAADLAAKYLTGVCGGCIQEDERDQTGDGFPPPGDRRRMQHRGAAAAHAALQPPSTTTTTQRQQSSTF